MPSRAEHFPVNCQPAIIAVSVKNIAYIIRGIRHYKFININKCHPLALISILLQAIDICNALLIHIAGKINHSRQTIVYIFRQSF